MPNLMEVHKKVYETKMVCVCVLFFLDAYSRQRKGKITDF